MISATACHYSIIRFLPFVETGEFANVGVVLFAPQARRFAFRILSARVGRITAFFEHVDVPFVRNAIRAFEEELTRVGEAFKAAGTDRRFRELDMNRSMALWHELLKPRETILRLGESRVVMANDPVQKLKELFAFYVERDFVTREYQEQVLERAVRRLLHSVDLSGRFVPSVVGNDEYHTRFPFVELADGTPLKAIKPLHLTHSDAARIIDHGGQWAVRVGALRKRGLLPKEVLFAIDADGEADTPRGRAQLDVIDHLRQLDVRVAPLAEPQQIITFASGLK